MPFFDQLIALGYVGTNLAFTFFFMGGFVALAIGFRSRSRSVQIAYVSTLIGLFVVTVHVLEPTVTALRDDNVDWREQTPVVK